MNTLITPKFKALYRDKWYVVEELHMYADGSYGVGKFQNEDFSPDAEHVKAIVQYIGVNDKYEKEIYFGDILEVQGNRRWGKYNTTVVWNGCGFGLKLNHTNWHAGIYPFHNSKILGSVFTEKEGTEIK